MEYWIEKFDGDIEKAKKHHNERQTTFNMEICIEKYGEEEGMRIWKERQDKWQKNLLLNGNMKSGYSKISQELFDKIINYYSDDNSIYYATKNREIVMRCFESNKNFQFDFTDIENKK